MREFICSFTDDVDEDLLEGTNGELIRCGNCMFFYDFCARTLPEYGYCTFLKLKCGKKDYCSNGVSKKYGNE